MGTANPLLEGVESSLSLLGAAFANISKLRCSNALRNVAPSLAPMLKDPRVFSTRESEHLFGVKFIDAMIKEVDADAKLAKLGRNGGPSTGQSIRGNFRRVGDRSHGHSGGFHRNAHGSNDKSGNRGKGFSAGQSSAKQHGHVGYVSIPLCTSVVMSHVGGRMRHFASAWNSVSDYHWVLNTVAFDYVLDFVTPPVQLSLPSVCIMSTELEAVVDQEISTLLAKGAVRLVLSVQSRNGFVSNLFAIPKKSGFRVILNFKKLNQFLA